ncbi:unnamed protein product [Acidithrix sp. C25]|nr:unnamed protein product [Acidithrix sp. C25]
MRSEFLIYLDKICSSQAAQVNQAAQAHQLCQAELIKIATPPFEVGIVRNVL